MGIVTLLNGHSAKQSAYAHPAYTGTTPLTFLFSRQSEQNYQNSDTPINQGVIVGYFHQQTIYCISSYTAGSVLSPSLSPSLHLSIPLPLSIGIHSLCPSASLCPSPPSVHPLPLSTPFPLSIPLPLSIPSLSPPLPSPSLPPSLHPPLSPSHSLAPPLLPSPQKETLGLTSQDFRHHAYCVLAQYWRPPWSSPIMGWGSRLLSLAAKGQIWTVRLPRGSPLGRGNFLHFKVLGWRYLKVIWRNSPLKAPCWGWWFHRENHEYTYI